MTACPAPERPTPRLATARDRVVSILGAERPALLLAPMATVTHAGFRRLVADFGGCDLYWTEMLSAEALVGGTPYESYYLDASPEPGRTVYQLIGFSHDTIVAAVRILAQARGRSDDPVAGIDINFGCSAPHLVRRGGGIAWMADPDAACRLIEALRPISEDASLSVKLRLGRDDDPDGLVSLCRRLSDAGLDFLTLHPKRQRDGEQRAARWSSVALLRNALTIPVVGNGGVTGWEPLERRLRAAGPGPVMVGRAAIRSPWIFRYLTDRLAGSATPTVVDLAEVAARFHDYLEASQPADFLPSRARRFYPYFMSNFAFGHRVGARLSQTRDYQAGKRALAEYLETHEAERVYTERA